MVDARTVCNNYRRPGIGLRLAEGIDCLLEICAERHRGHIDCAIGHHHATEVLFECTLAVDRIFSNGSKRSGFRGLTACVGIAFGVHDKDVDILAACQHMIKSGETNVVGPAVAADGPNRLFAEHIGIGENHPELRRACGLIRLFNQRHKFLSGLLRDINILHTGNPFAHGVLYVI